MRLASPLAGGILLTLAMGCAHAPPPPPPSPPPARLSSADAELQHRYSGSYVYAGGDSERRAVQAAVEHAISTMSFLAKPVARSSLKQRAEVRDAYTLSFDGLGNVQIVSPGFPVEGGPLDGKPSLEKNKYGDESQVTFSFVSGVLVQKGRSDEGSGETDFRLADDGATLLVHRVMQSQQLSAPVDFTLTYRRQ
ncbi:MAG: hypothetical protein ACLPJH_17605 [Myxococcaceae bacterium]